jgi:cytoskeletal protein CcmA (bactofilin family)
MFNRKADRLKLVLGESSKITGDIESLGTIIVDGTVVGHIMGEKVILGAKACVRGDIAAKTIIVGGKIDGCLNGKERVELKASAQVLGDICTSRLSVVEGAIFHGTSLMIQSGTLEQDGKKPEAQADDGKIVELFLKDKTG